MAKRIVAETQGAVLADQYHNPANPDSHYQTTGPEIWEQTAGRVTDIVIGMGTGGTLTGVARYMRDHAHDVHIVGVDPIGSILYKAWEQGRDAQGFEAFTYKVEGIGEDFIPTTLDLSLADAVIQVDDAESFRWTRRLVREEGIFSGGSSGAALAGALKYAQGLPADRLVVVIFPDSGSRYLSKLFDDEWMLEHGFLERYRSQVMVQQVAKARGLPSLITATQDERITDVIGKMRANGVSQLPVVGEHGVLQGMVSEVELLEHMLTHSRDSDQPETIEPMINRDVRSARLDAQLEEVLHDLMVRKVVVLTDELDRPQGILTIIDALEFLAVPVSAK